MALPPPPGPVQLHFYNGHSFLYCHDCHCVTVPSGLADHMLRLHKPLPSALRRRVVRYYTTTTLSSEDLITQHEQMAQLLPPDYSLPLSFLPTKGGFACGYDGCRFLSRSYKRLRVHLNEAHFVLGAACAPYIQRVSLQSWYSGNHKYASYWIVTANNKEGEAGGAAGQQRALGTSSANAQLAALDALHAQEQQSRVRVEQDSAAQEPSCPADDSSITPWLEYIQWPKQFSGRPLSVLVATAILPQKLCLADYSLGVWEGQTLVSPREDELRLARLVRAVDLVFDRCLCTLEAIPELLRCWLKTFSLAGFYPKPFKPLARLTTLHRYKRYWKQFFCFIFRTWRVKPALRGQVYGVQVSATEEALMAQVWGLLREDMGVRVEGASASAEGEEDQKQDCQSDWKLGEGSDSDYSLDTLQDEPDSEPDSELGSELDDDPDEDLDGNDAETRQGGNLGLTSSEGLELVERLFQLSCAFWTNVSTTGATLHLPLVYFSGILGIQRESLVYRTAYLYTSILAGLVYAGRLLMLEYALPRQAYRTLGWPDCSVYPDQLERLQLIRKKYLCRGGCHPMSRLLELLYRGRTIAKKEGARANISWLADGQVLQLCVGPTQRQHQIEISQFRAMVWVTIQDCQGALKELMFDWRPPRVELEKIRDNLTNRQEGWWFLKEPANQLRYSYRQLSQQAWILRNKGLMVRGQWCRRRSEEYLQLVAEFSRLLLVCIHFSGGLPGRTTEVTTLRHQNTRQVMRNIFVHNGRLVIITEYHKARSRTNFAFYVVRILPQLVSQILFQYLVYVRPFADSLSYQAQLNYSCVNSPLAFPTMQGEPLASSQMTAVIKEQTQKSCQASLGVAAYRQVAIAIAKRHIASIAKPFNLHSPVGTFGQDLSLGLARQCGHTLQTLATSYALDQAYPTRLQPELIRQYETVSEQWHQWLQIGELGQKLDNRARQVQNGCTGLARTARKAQPLQQQKLLQRPFEQLPKQPTQWLPSGHAPVQRESTQTPKRTLDSLAQTGPYKRQARAESLTVSLYTPPPTSLATICTARTTVNPSLLATPTTQDWSTSPTAL